MQQQQQRPQGSRQALHPQALGSLPLWATRNHTTWKDLKSCRAHALPPAALSAPTPAGPHRRPGQQAARALAA
jgi:hypothetical protein